MICHYCNKNAEKVTGREVYSHRPDLASKIIYRCKPCGASVGCHPGTDRPLGILANAALRKKKMAAHAAFDPLWRSKRMSRHQAYAWLAGELGVKRDDCHIGMFSEAMCERVVKVVKERGAAT